METTSSREVYRNPWTRVREDTVVLADGSTGVYGVVERPDYAVVLPAQDDGFWLVEQYRHPLGRRSWEFPQGGWPPGHTGSAEDLARTELAEETGFRAGRLRHLGRLDDAPGLSTQRFDVWLATDLTPGPPAREASEADMVQALVAERELVARIRSGGITDASTLAAYALLLVDRA
ncbi:NUDIX hydrolase [Klenkia sp. LSe6-5]|uniref:NUDIX hydrolase n=1 Tax=Klenkia sesuvii TaxID=3103137 RepID=A0ABU8DTG2_9ACTN